MTDMGGDVGGMIQGIKAPVLQSTKGKSKTRVVPETITDEVPVQTFSGTRSIRETTRNLKGKPSSKEALSIHKNKKNKLKKKK